MYAPDVLPRGGRQMTRPRLPADGRDVFGVKNVTNVSNVSNVRNQPPDGVAKRAPTAAKTSGERKAAFPLIGWKRCRWNSQGNRQKVKLAWTSRAENPANVCKLRLADIESAGRCTRPAGTKKRAPQEGRAAHFMI